MKYRVDLDFIGLKSAAKAYGGYLKAWSFVDIEGEEWFSAFQDEVLGSIGKRFLPIYRMADGEYRFLMGRKYNFHKRPIALAKEIIAVSLEKLKIKNPDKWKTSWGEEYTPHEVRVLRVNLEKKIGQIANTGYLACYINDNGLYAFTEFNKYLFPYFHKKDIPFHHGNYIPFHFVIELLIKRKWREFYVGRNILVVSGTNDESEDKIGHTIRSFGAKNVDFLRISANTSMKDNLDLSAVFTKPDICFVAAGIGSANILVQLEPFNTVVLDIGGYINCFRDPGQSQHGGVFYLPEL